MATAHASSRRCTWLLAVAVLHSLCLAAVCSELSAVIKESTATYVDFNGKADRIMMDPVQFVNTDLSFELVYKQFSTSSWDRLFQFRMGTSDNSYMALLKDSDARDGRVFFEIGRQVSPQNVAKKALRQNTFDTALDTWHHLIVTVKANGDAQMFVDGDLIAYGATQPYKPGTYTLNSLGGDFQPTPYAHHGAIALFRVYDSALDADEAAQVFANRTLPDSLRTKLRYEFLMDEGFGTSLSSTADALSGSFRGFPLWKQPEQQAQVLGSLAATHVEFLSNPDKIVLPGMAFPGGAFTMEVVFRHKELRRWGRLFTFRQSEAVEKHVTILTDHEDVDHALAFEYKYPCSSGICVDKVLQTRIPSDDDELHHAIVTVDEDGSVVFWMDSSIVATGTVKPVEAFQADAASISGAGFAGSQSYQSGGAIAYAACYTRKLSDDNIRRRFQGLSSTTAPWHAWALNEGAGLIAADSAGDANGQLVGTPLWVNIERPLVNSISQRFVALDGLDDSLRLPSVTVGSEMAMEIVYRADNIDTNFGRLFILEASSTDLTHVGLIFDNNPDNRWLFFEVKTLQPSRDYAFSDLRQYDVRADGEWHHVVLSMSSNGQCRFWIDGSLVGSGLVTPPRPGLYQANTIGSAQAGASSHAQIDVALARLYSSALTDDEVVAAYKAANWRVQNIQAQVRPPTVPNLSKMIHSWEFEDGTGTAVEDMRGSSDLEFVGGPLWKTSQDCDGAFAEIYVSTSMRDHSNTRFAIHYTIHGSMGQGGPFVLSSTGFLQGESRLVTFCVSKEVGELEAITLLATSDDGWDLDGATVVYDERSYSWDVRSFVDGDGTASYTIRLEEAMETDESVCVSNDKDVIVVTVETGNVEYAGSVSAFYIEVEGAKATSKPILLAHTFPADDTRRIVRCVERGLGEFQAITFENTRSDGLWLSRLSVEYGEENYSWVYNDFIENEGDKDFKITFSISDHEDVAGATCPYNRFAVIALDITDREHSNTDSAVYGQIQGTKATSREFLLGHDFKSDTAGYKFKRCLDQDVGHFQSITIRNSGNDGVDIGRIVVTFQGATFDYTLRPPRWIKASETASVTFSRGQSDRNPVSIAATANPCMAGEVCPDDKTCASTQSWSLLYESNFTRGGLDGWEGVNIFQGNLEAFQCEDSDNSNVLVGQDLTDISSLARTATKLPDHNTLRLQMTLLRMERHAGEQLFVEVDGYRVYQATMDTDDATTSQCTSQSEGRVRIHAKTRIDVVLPHQADDVSVRVGVELAVDTETESLPRIAVSNVALWTSKLSLKSVADEQYTNNEDVTWSGVGLHDDTSMPAVTTCGSLGSILGGVGVVGHNSVLERCLADLESHTHLALDISVAAIDFTANDELSLELDGTVVWRSGRLQRSTNPFGAAECGQAVSDAAPWLGFDQAVALAVVAPHSASEANIRLRRGSPVVPQQDSTMTFGIRTFQVSAVQAPSFSCDGDPFQPSEGSDSTPMPPAPSPLKRIVEADDCESLLHYECSGAESCRLAQAWQPVLLDNFEEGNDDWSGTNVYGCKGLVSTQCGDEGLVLGGFDVLSRHSQVSTTLTNLPAHHKVLVYLKLFALDSWDDERFHVSIGDQTITTATLSAFDGVTANLCGRSSPDLVYEVLEELVHSGSSLQLSVTTNLDGIGMEESWALAEAQVFVANASSSFMDVVSYGDETLSEVLFSTDGPGVVRRTCPDGTPFVRTLRAGDVMKYQQYSLPAHDMLRVKVTMLLDASSSVTIAVDGKEFVRTASAADDGADCSILGSDVKTASFEILVVHTTPSVAVSLRSDSLCGIAELSVESNGSPLVCTCGEGTYLAADECKACHPSCVQCDGSDDTSCTACGTDSFLELGRCRSCSPCDSGTYQETPCSQDSNTVCRECHPACSLCTGAGQASCTACSKGYLLSDSGICLPVCEAGQYRDDTNGECKACHPSCASCTGPSDVECVACASGRYELEGLCLSECPAGFFADMDAQRCKRCHASCAVCTQGGPESCVSCAAGHIRGTDGLCKVICARGWFLDENGDCSQCDGSCAECTGPGPSDCTACDSDRYLSEASCVSDCPSGWFEEAANNVCYSCNSACNECTGATATLCEQCADSHWQLTYATGLVECVRFCPSGYFANQTTAACQQCRALCPDGQYTSVPCTQSSDAVCSPCEPGCDRCADAEVCLACKAGYGRAVSGASCVVCPTTCPSGQYLTGTCDAKAVAPVCADCDSNCKACEGSSTRCISCKQGHQLQINTCVRQDDPSAAEGAQEGEMPIWALIVIVGLAALFIVSVILLFVQQKRQQAKAASLESKAASGRQATFVNPVYGGEDAEGGQDNPYDNPMQDDAGGYMDFDPDTADHPDYMDTDALHSIQLGDGEDDDIAGYMEVHATSSET